MPASQPTPRFRQRAAKMSELVARQILEDIVEQGLSAGAALPTEAQMLQGYGVSRGTLREALRILEINGLVRVRPGRGGGPVVGAVDPHTFGRTMALFMQMGRTRFGELVEARVIMEPLMARLAAERRDAGRLRELAESMREHRSLEERDEASYLAVMQRFHGVVAGLSGNGVLDLFGRALKEIYTERVVAAERRPERWEEVRREHEAVAAAIVAGDGVEAERLMRAHMVALAGHLVRDYAGVQDEVVGWW
ncbi:FadR/GntR family transcriptional regulator [Micromonospora craniellae]|uniref:FadR family transcriptional regulator n=1 Tax=Micromonospora craniellae TaxID=2294034 RepID=A0A372G161_9ACTN|nr:FCD domain-containing protein [Micromonospora craniellae]QOC91848.1 FadR family transcriptional regulator [Micromonospora craniellae]RFS46678.1 FadR family transcriptional regulator [Micromonospora craniellae]